MATDELTPAVDGNDVKLTINTDIQYFAQQAIQSQVNKMNAEWGVIIVIDIKTGNLIAMADTNAPDPNDPGKVDAKDRGVRSVTAAYEPGSVEKMITAAAADRGGQVLPAGPLHHPHRRTPWTGRPSPTPSSTAPKNAPLPASWAGP